MRTALSTVSVLALAVGGSAAGRTERPELRAMGTSPLVLQGVHFKPGERVSVQVLAPARAGRSVLANTRGSFRLRLRLRVGQCERVSAHAFGSRGSRARLLPQRELGYCPPSR